MTDLCYQRLVKRPTVDEVLQELRRWEGIIVHFSGVPPGMSAGTNLAFPADLQYVIAGNAQRGISCSTVRPGDRFEAIPPSTWRNSWGCIGVIVRPQHPWSLVGVDRHDAGSGVPPNGSWFRHCKHSDIDLTLREVIDSLHTRDPLDCNEWVMRDYDVLGVLVQPPFSARGFGQCASWNEIATAFSAERLFTLQPNGLYEVNHNGTLGPMISLASLYP